MPECVGDDFEGTPVASNSDARECRSSRMLQCPSPAALHILGTDLPKTSGSCGAPMVDVKTKSAGLRQTRAVLPSCSYRARWALKGPLRPPNRCLLPGCELPHSGHRGHPSICRQLFVGVSARR